MDIALTVGGSFLSSFLQVLFDRMAKPEFLNLFRKQKFDYQILEKLKWKLLILQAVLEDAETKQSKNLAVKMWLDELQEVVYQADDLLDQINTEALRVKVESEYPSPTNQVCASADPSKFSIEFLKEIMPKLEEIVKKLEDFEQKIGILGLINEVESKKHPFRLPSTSLVDENDVYGRDVDKKKVIQALFSDDVATRENVSVISIVGLGGVGKTTLAQFVYNDERVNKQFDTKAWVCISEDYDAIRITKLLLNELNISSSDSNENFNSLQVKLKQGLSKKKFLLVLDDIWNRDYNDWVKLSTPFNGGKEGSKIIVTTRDEKVALTIGNRHIYSLSLMSEEDCWSLLKKHAFNNRDGTGNLEFELTGKEIVKKCGGLPLAVKAVAGLLRSKETIEEWNEILRSDEWDQPNNYAGILPSLRLSYTHLSSQLKRCFAYCAVFHKDYRFSKDEVILLWMANDLLESPRSNKRLEDVGDEFFRELRFRSLFQQSSDGKFSMHDLVNDLAKFVSGKYFFRLEDHWQQNGLEDYRQQNGSSFVVRHFSYISTFTDVFEKFKPLNGSKFLRTFLPLKFNENAMSVSQKFLRDVLLTSKSLRILSLSGYRITELPNSFANLKQLRFLDLSFTTIKKLPSSICTFYNLQTLLLAKCYGLKEFPEDMEKLINLRLLDVSGVPLTKMPMEIGRLENLQYLSTFIISKCGSSGFEKLGKLCNLRGELTISGLENVADCENASMAKMKGKKHIKKLTLEWNGDCDTSQLAQDVLEKLQPHSNIEHLKINGYWGTRFPNWLQDSSFCHMISLRISNCENCFWLPAIGQLSSLKHLTISGLSKVIEIGQEFYGNTKAFPCLRELRILNMEEWREWHIPQNGVFSCLEEVRISDCPKLIGEIPKQLPSLRKLFIEECPGLVNSEGGLTIFDSRVDFASLRHLWISGMPNLKELSSSSSLSDLNKLLPHLEMLVLRGCEDIVSFPINRLPSTLKQLRIERCGNLELEETRDQMTHASIEELHISGAIGSIKNLLLSSCPALQRLNLWNVRNMEELSIPQAGNQQNILISLRSLLIDSCDNFRSFPIGGLPAPYLTYISLSHLPKLKSLLERMHTLLPSLRQLNLNFCPGIECFPEGGLPSSLQSLEVWNCPGIECFPEGGLPSSLQHLTIGGNCGRLWSCRREWGLQRLPSLTSLLFSNIHEEETLPPEDLLLPSTLTYLIFSSNENLKMLNHRFLQHLTCLQSLCIWNCPRLQSLPEEGLPASLSELFIRDCPLLKQRLEWEKGEDWPKVAHIPCIKVGLELIP